jgi:hypothetical protein
MSEMEKRKYCDDDDDSRMDDSNDFPSKQQPSKRNRSASPSNSQLPSVNDLLKVNLVLRGLTAEGAYNNEEKAYILLNVFATVAEDPQWQNVLNADFEKLTKCKEAVNDNEGLAAVIDKCIKSADWQALFNHPSQLFSLFIGVMP